MNNEEIHPKKVLETMLNHIIEDYKLDEHTNDDEVIYKIELDNPNALIGVHGSTISSLEYILNQILFKHHKSWFNARVDVNDYRSERRKQIEEIADNAITKVRFLQQSVRLFPMNNFDRRVVHEFVAQTDDLVSFSEGEKRNRRVIIALKNESSDGLDDNDESNDS